MSWKSPVFQIKLILAIISVAGAAFGGYTIYSLIGDNAVLRASVEARDKAMISYADNVNATIEEYTIQNSVLQEAFEYAALDAREYEQKVDSHDYEEMAKRHPVLLKRALDNGFNELFDLSRKATGFKDPEAATTTKPDPDQSGGS